VAQVFITMELILCYEMLKMNLPGFKLKDKINVIHFIKIVKL